MMFTAPAIDPSLLIKTSVPGIRSHSMMSMFPPSILAMFNVMSRDCMSIAFLIDVLRLANGGHRSWKAIAGGVFLGDDVVSWRFVCVCGSKWVNKMRNKWCFQAGETITIWHRELNECKLEFNNILFYFVFS